MDHPLYQCMTMFFGMGPAPRCFTKLMKVPMAMLRKLQIRTMIYIDDIIILAQQERDTLMARDTILYILESLGLTVNYAKSILEPCKRLQYLGMVIKNPLMLPQNLTLLTDPMGVPHPLLKAGKLRLAAWLVSGQN